MRGAAFATVLAEVAAAVLVLSVLSRGRTVVKLHRRHWAWRGDLLWRLLKVGLPSSGQMLSRSLMNLVLMRIVAECGTLAVGLHEVTRENPDVANVDWTAEKVAVAAIVFTQLKVRRNKDVNFIRQAYPNPATTGKPKHYAIFGPRSDDVNELSFIIGPTPNAT